MILPTIALLLLISRSYGWRFGQVAMTYPDAIAYCNSIGSTLATITSDQDRDETKRMCRRNYNSQYGCWIGLYSDDGAQTWKWQDGSALGYGFNADGSPTKSIDPWANGEPNNAGAAVEDCGQIASHLNWGWNDASCTAHLMNPICNDPVRRIEPITGMIITSEASGQTVSLQCNRGINAIAAIYGANCRKGDQGSLPGGERQDGPMKQDCYGQKSCDYKVDHLAIGDPCIGTVKDFYYAYTCNGNPFGVNVGSVGVNEASGQSFTIDCPGNNRVIKVAEAIYGLNCQITPRVCGAGAGLAYGTSASPLDVTDSVQTECNGKSSCTYNINHANLGDPCVCVVKDFVYAYQCVPPRLVAMDEYEDMDLVDFVDYEFAVAKGIENGEVTMMTFFNSESLLIKAMIILVGLLSVYGLYTLFTSRVKAKDSKGEYQKLLNHV